MQSLSYVSYFFKHFLFPKTLLVMLRDPVIARRRSYTLSLFHGVFLDLMLQRRQASDLK
jgi:hypothetical protein